MSYTSTRRHFMRSALTGAATITWTMAGGGILRHALAQAGSNGPIGTQPLRRDLVQITGAGGNCVLLSNTGGAAMVDSGAPEFSADLVAHVAGLTGDSDLELLINTHWHTDHTGANDVYGAAGARIVAHENTRLWMSTEYYVDWQDHTYGPRAPEALPNDTFFSSDPQPIVTEFGDEEIEYGHLREAHTDGDIYVRFRRHNVIVAGGVVAAGAYPVLDFATGGWIGGLIDATEKLIAMADAETLIIPAEGPAQGPRHLENQHNMLVTVRERMENMMRDGKSAAEMVEEGATAGFDAEWGTNRERFVYNVYGGLWWQGRLTNSL